MSCSAISPADLDSEMIAVARERWPAGEFHVGDVCDLPLETGSASYYRADKVLHTLDDPARAVAEGRRVLAPGGRAVLGRITDEESWLAEQAERARTDGSSSRVPMFLAAAQG